MGACDDDYVGKYKGQENEDIYVLVARRDGAFMDFTYRPPEYWDTSHGATTPPLLNEEKEEMVAINPVIQEQNSKMQTTTCTDASCKEMMTLLARPPDVDTESTVHTKITAAITLSELGTRKSPR